MTRNFTFFSKLFISLTLFSSLYAHDLAQCEGKGKLGNFDVLIWDYNQELIDSTEPSLHEVSFKVANEGFYKELFFTFRSIPAKSNYQIFESNLVAKGEELVLFETDKTIELRVVKKDGSILYRFSFDCSNK